MTIYSKYPTGYYVYAYIRKNNLTPYYIGKGKRDRAWSTRCRITKPPTDQNKIIIIAENLTEETAFMIEKIHIKIWGRKDNGTGILYNKTDGGEGVSGTIWTTERKNIASEKRTHNRWWNNGKLQKFCELPPDNTWVRGRLLKTNNTHNKGKRYWNNGTENKFQTDCPGEGWIPGQIKTDKKIWNNDVKRKVQSSCPGEGWVIGCLPHGTAWHLDGKIKWSHTKPDGDWKLGYPPNSSYVLGRKWWNNGTLQKYEIECPGKDWKQGRIMLNGNKGKKYWTDGKSDKIQFECPVVTDGFLAQLVNEIRKINSVYSCIEIYQQKYSNLAFCLGACDNALFPR